MKKLVSAAIIAATLIAPIQAQAAEVRKVEESNDNMAPILLLGMLGVVIFSSQLGLGATRDDAAVMVVPGASEDGDLVFVAE